jgi:myo-inositol-1(or 4)-monophosphatase
MATVASDLALARELAARAGTLLREGAFRAHRSDRKRTAVDLVTSYDKKSEALIVEALRAARPSDRIVAEEAASRGTPPPSAQGRSGGGVEEASSRRWLIDPLDGTTNFAHGLPFFVVSIGLEVDGRLAVGVVEAPALGWSFWASRGDGAFLNGEPIRVSETASLAESLLATGFPYDNAISPKNNFAEFVALYQRTQGVRRVGAAALDLAMVAAGWMDGYWEMKLKPWDLAAGSLLVEEAGGRVTSWRGEPFSVDSGEAVATNARIHDELVGTLGTLG